MSLAEIIQYCVKYSLIFFPSRYVERVVDGDKKTACRVLYIIFKHYHNIKRQVPNFTLSVM